MLALAFASTANCAYGWVLWRNQERIGDGLGAASAKLSGPHVASYAGLIFALRYLDEKEDTFILMTDDGKGDLVVMTDDGVVLEHIVGRLDCQPHLVELRDEARRLLTMAKERGDVTLRRVAREQNDAAVKMSEGAL